jgi:hypothetical protein
MRQYAEFRFAMNSTFTFLLTVIYSLLNQGCGSSEQIASKWSESRIQIDGNLKEWSDSTVFADKDGIRWGVMNDDEYLYLCVMSAKPNLGRQVMARGMTVWFDPNGGEKKTLGVRFPIGMSRGGAVPIQEEGEDKDQRGNSVPLMGRQALNEFEFLGPTENDIQMVPRMQGQGVELHLTSTPERFVYELKIPLASSSKHPYAVESHKGAAIGVGVETNTPGRAAANEGSGEGRGEGGRGGRTGGGGGRGGRMPGGMGPGGGRQTGANVAFSFWSHVQLAEKAR